MSFDVTFWTFGKRERSTAQPGGQGTTISCIANDPLDLLAPVLKLKYPLDTQSPPTVWNYAGITTLGRYYWVTGWTIRDSMWWCELRVDSLASWKSGIGSNSIYVYRSSYSFDGDIVDTLYPTIAKYRRFNVALPRMWSLDSATALVAQGGGMFVLGIVGNGQTQYYGFSASNLDTFLANLFSQSYYDAVLGAFGASQYPEAKVAVNPLQYVSSVRFFPCGFGVPGTAWALHITGAVSSIPVGPVSVTATASTFRAVGSYPDQTSYNSTYIDIPIDTTDFVHPQAQDRGDFLQLAPYTSYEVFYPPWGVFSLDSASLVDADSIRLEITVDIRSNSGVLTIYANYDTNKRQVVARTTAQVGIECPLSAIMQPGSTTMSLSQGILNAGLNLLAGNIGGAVGALTGTVGDAVKNEIPHLSVVGSQSSGAAMAGAPLLQVVHRYLADDDYSGRGRPLCKVRQISNIPGYILGDPDEIQVTGATETELQEIRSAVSEGFYYA